MKRITTFFALLGLLFIGCEGSVGPPGPPGIPGEDGINGILGQVFEAEAFFTSGNDYQFLVDIPSNIEVFESDVVIAYILVRVENDLDIWEPLPQTLFFGKDILLYSFDHTLFDVNFFLDGTINLASLDPSFTDGIIFRVAVIPADYAEQIDVNKLENVMQAFKIDKVKRVN